MLSVRGWVFFRPWQGLECLHFSNREADPVTQMKKLPHRHDTDQQGKLAFTCRG